MQQNQAFTLISIIHRKRKALGINSSRIYLLGNKIFSMLTFAPMKVIPGDIKTAQLHAYLLGAVAPRPICFASTIDSDGQVNLSPFSFFNVFGSKPPILIFSPSRRVRDNTNKHTLENIYETKEVVVNIVNYP